MGYPASLYGSASDTFLTLPADLTLGQCHIDLNTGHKRMLVKANGTITPGQAVAYDATQANNYTVVACPTGQNVLGINDTSGSAGGTTVTVAANPYFWATTGGPCTPLVTASTAAGVPLACNTTAGTLTTAANTDVSLANVETRAASGGSGGATACWFFG